MADKRDPERTQAPDEEVYDVNAPENVAVERLQEDLEEGLRRTGGTDQSIDVERTTRLARDQYEPGNLNTIIGGLIPEDGVDRNFSTFLGMAKRYTLSQYKNDTIKNAGFIKGIVLHSWEEEQTQDVRHGPTGLEPDSKKALRVKVRIPELHAHIPLPTSLPVANSISDVFADWASINLHPTFEAADTSIAKLSNGIPTPGEIVYVDFEHRPSQSGPIYLGPVLVDFQFDYPNPPSPDFSNPGEIGQPLAVEAEAGLEFNLTAGRPFTNFGQRSKDVDTIVIHESVVKGREPTHRVLEDKQLSIEYMVDEDGSVTQHIDPEKGYGYHGGGKHLNTGGVNGRSIGIEIINRYDATAADENDGPRIIDDYLNPPRAQHEACYRLIVSLVNKFPKLQMVFFGVRTNRFYWRAIGRNPIGITAHAHYVAAKADGISTSFYCAMRARGYSEEESFAYLKDMITIWRTDQKRAEGNKQNYILINEPKSDSAFKGLRKRVTILDTKDPITSGLGDHNKKQSSDAGSGSSLPTETDQTQT